jgi:HK97 family phage major capsid protein
VATSSSGGYLVSPATTLAAADALRPWSIAVSAGITVEAGLVGNISIPLTTGTSTGEWLASETTQIGTSSPTLGNVTLAPKNGGAHVQFSRQLALQSSAETFIQRELLRTVGGMLDRAILSGTGTSEPLGILNTANVPAASGASLNVAAIAALEGDVGNANVMDENISLVTHPDVRELLRKRVATGSGRFCWERDVCGLPGYTTTGLGTNVAIVGGWAEAILGLWGPGPEFMLNPYQNFQAAIVGARVMVAADVGVRFPAAFSVSTGIT